MGRIEIDYVQLEKGWGCSIVVVKEEVMVLLLL